VSDPKKVYRTMARARVQLTLDVDAGSTWESSCPVGQIHEQAAREAVEMIERVLPGRIRVIGEPKVTAVSVEKVPS
jgi:hypothetical protein